MKEITYTRQELHNLVWTETKISISQKYIITDKELNDICRKMEIPIPETGYWTSLRFGKEPPKGILSDNYTGDDEVILKLREFGDENIVAGENPIKSLQRIIEADPAVNLKVPLRLTNPDNLIDLTKDDFEKRTKDSFYGGDLIKLWDSLDIKVSKQLFPRALRIMDTLIKAFKSRGHKVIRKNYETHIVVEGQELKIYCIEKTTRVIVKDRWGDSYKFNPNGKLSIKSGVYNQFEWTDGKLPLEEQLSLIVAALEIKGHQLRERHLRWEQERKIEEEQKRKRIEQEKKIEQELKNFKALFKKARRHNKAEMIRAYADKFERSLISNGTLTQDNIDHITWMRKKADWYDPFIEREDELLKEVDREKLEFRRMFDRRY